MKSLTHFIQVLDDALNVLDHGLSPIWHWAII